MVKFGFPDCIIRNVCWSALVITGLKAQSSYRPSKLMWENMGVTFLDQFQWSCRQLYAYRTKHFVAEGFKTCHLVCYFGRAWHPYLLPTCFSPLMCHYVTTAVGLPGGALQTFLFRYPN